MRSYIQVRLEGSNAGYVLVGEAMSVSPYVSLGHTIDFYLGEHFVSGTVDMVRHEFHALASEIYGGTFQLSDTETLCPPTINITVGIEYKQVFLQIVERVMKTKLYSDTVYACQKCEHKIVRNADGWYPANLLVHCGAVMREVSRD